MSTKNIVISIVMGTIFWLGAALTIRLISDSLLQQSQWYMVLFGLVCVPLSYGFMFGIAQVTGLGFGQLLRPMVLATLTATTLDAVALTWFRTLYSQTDTGGLLGAALILFGAGMGLLLALLHEQKSAASA